MPVTATADALSGSSLSARLTEPLVSTDELLDLLLPPLQCLSVLPDHPSLTRRHAQNPFPFQAERFARRQLGLVQKVLIEKVWPEWEIALEAEEGAAGLAVFERFFLPPPAAFASTSSNMGSAGADIAISAYSVLSSVLSSKTIATLPSRSIEIALDLLARLSSSFNIEQLYLATIGSSKLEKVVAGMRLEDEEDVVDPAVAARWDITQRVLLSVPTRAANAWGAMLGKGKKVANSFPQELHLDSYTNASAQSLANLVWRLADDATIPVSRSALSSILPSITAGSGLNTFLQLAIPPFLPPKAFPAPADLLLRRQRHIDLWRAITDELSERDLQRLMRAILTSLAQTLKSRRDGTVLRQARATAFVLDSFFGPLNPDSKATWKAALAVFFDVRSSLDIDLTALAAVFWAADDKACAELLKEVLKLWGDAEEIRAGLDSRRLYLTTLLLALVVYLPRLRPDLVTLSRSPTFLSAVSTHLSLVAPLQRLLGMLVAEVVSARTVNSTGELKALDFGAAIWDGDSPEKSRIRQLRGLLAEVESAATGKVEGWQDVLRGLYSTELSSPRAPAPAPTDSAPSKLTIVEEPPVQPTKPKRPMISIIGDDDSDDDFEPLPLPPSPSEATLEALASDDPALYHSAFPSQQAATAGPAGGSSQTRKRGKLRPPVYIPELVAYLKGEDPQGAKEEADGEAERVEMGLKEGEALVRRKAGWGGELRENAVDLAFALMGLHNKFELHDFERHKQSILVALVVACPTEVAPAVIEQYFTNSYSGAQRHVLLAALALSVRELAGLPAPTTTSRPQTADQDERFPSKRLPPQLHRRLAGSASADGPVEALSADLTRMALSGARADAETSLPEAAREKLLQVRGTTRRSARLDMVQVTSSTPTFASIAADTFILPLINRFWLYLRDTATSSLGSRHSQPVGPYAGGAPAPMLLEPILLAKFLATLAVLVHAARHSPAFLAVIVPETLAFVLAIKPAHPSAVSSARIVDEDTGLNADLVVSTALELVLVALDATVQLDGGRTLMSSSASNGDSGAIVADVKDWSEEVFECAERRGGEIGVDRPGRAAAGVLLRVDEIVGRWRVAVGW